MIYFTHGLVAKWDGNRISHALMLPQFLFVRYLRERRTKFVPLHRALAGEGDALTVDDASYAGMLACMQARRYGHAVSWFVNGEHVETRRPYFPYQLSSMLDQTRKESCEFAGRTWELSRIHDRKVLRLYLKQTYMQMRTYADIDMLIAQVSECLGVDPGKMEKGLTTVSREDLATAFSAGVELQNHGWCHLNPAMLSDADQTVDLQRNDQYLARYTQARPRIFAPPFGGHISSTVGALDFTLLANRNLITGLHVNSVFNRADLALHVAPPRAAAAPQVATAPLAMSRSWE